MQSKKIFIFLFLFFLNKNLTIFAENIKPVIRKEEGIVNKVKSLWSNKDPYLQVKIPMNGMSGTIPYNLYLLIKEMQKDNLAIKNQASSNIDDLTLEPKEISLTPHVIVLHGPPGNGKTTLAKKVAELTQSIIIEKKGSSIVGKYWGDGPKEIDNFFLEARELNAEWKTRVILFIDEVDAFAIKGNNSNGPSEHEATTQTLWQNIDQIKGNKNFLVILATNKFKDLHPTLLDRIGDDAIELPNPDSNMRREVIQYCIKKFNTHIEKNELERLVNETKDTSIRSIENIIRSAKRRANLENDGKIQVQSLNQILNINKQKPKYNDNNEFNWKKTFQGMILLGHVIIIYQQIFPGIKNGVKEAWSYLPSVKTVSDRALSLIKIAKPI